MTNSTRILFTALLLCFSFSRAQKVDGEKSIYLAFDDLIGQENAGLLNGVEYIERNRTMNELDKFFLSQQFQLGTVIYDGQPYFEVEMKYNIWDDLLLARIPYNRGTPILELHKNKITSFQIEGHTFTNVDPEKAGNGIGGFYEILAENALFQLLKKHKLKEKTILDREYVYYEYKPNDPVYVLFYNGIYTEIDSKKDIMEQFPGQEKEIRKFYRSRRSLRKSDKDQFMANLLMEVASQKAPQN